jgi:hypothetical protein
LKKALLSLREYLSLLTHRFLEGINKQKQRERVEMVKREEMRLTRGGKVQCNGGGGASIMMGFKERAFAPLVAVSLEELVPQDHFYRHLQKVLDLSFVYDLVRESYAVAGRPSICG